MLAGSGVADIDKLPIPDMPPIPMFPTLEPIPGWDMDIGLYWGPCMLFIPGVGV